MARRVGAAAPPCRVTGRGPLAAAPAPASMKPKTAPVPRAQRARYQRLPLPLWVRLLVLTAGWVLIVVGVAGLFLPILQGGLSLALGFALLSIASQTVHLKLRAWMGRWPGLWRRLEKMRRRIHGWLHRRTSK
jgi:uncharacterized protein